MVIGTVDSLYALDLSFLQNLKIKALIVDLDQTLASPFQNLPDGNAIRLKEELSELGIELIVVSNNFRRRVEPFCSRLQVRFLPFAIKAFPFRVKAFLKKNRLKNEDVVFVGDQLRTDGKMCRMLSTRLILTRPLEEKDNLMTRFFRKRDDRMIQKADKAGKLGIRLPVIKRR